LDQVTLHTRNDQTLPVNEREVTDYVYDLLGNLDQVRLSNGMVSDYDYDTLGRLELLQQFRDTDQSGAGGTDTLP